MCGVCDTLPNALNSPRYAKFNVFLSLLRTNWGVKVFSSTDVEDYTGR